MAASQAAENNQKLFRRYAKMFALSDPNVYISHAEKLSLWLNDFKAYYTTARPEIVKLLLIAQVTLRKALGLAEHLNSPFNICEYSEYPMVKAYVKLVKTVEPFESYFTEPSLLAHIRSLLASVSPLHAPGDSQQSVTHVQSDIQSQALPLSSHISETQITDPSSNTMTSASNIPPVAAKAQVKPKKRKAVNFDLLVQRDIKALLEKRGNQGPSQPAIEDQAMASPNPLVKALLEKKGNQGPSQPVTEDQAMAPPNSLGDPPPSEKTSLVVEFRDISAQAVCEDPKIAAPDQTTESLPSQDSNAIAEAQGTSPPVFEDQMIAASNQNIEPLLSQDTRAVAKTQGTSSQAVIEDQEMAPPDSGRESPTPAEAIEYRDHASKSVAEDQEMAAADTADAPQSSEDAGVFAEPQGSSWQSVTEEEERQEMAAGDLDSLPLPSKKTSATIDIQELGATMISKESVTASPQPPLQSQTRNVTPPVSSDHLGSILPVQEVRPLIPPASVDNMVKSSSHSPMPACEGKFGQEMRIVAVVKGLSKECTISFTCTISSSLFPKVSAWLNRNNFSSNIEHSLCLSLGCYSIAGLQEQSTNKCTLEQQTSVARSYWPQKGGLRMNVQFKNGREDLPLSPPFQVTPDGFVDVSQFLFAGENLIKLNQTTNMSQYVFVLHSHYPTRAQLQEVDGRRQRDSEWQEWIRHVSKPLDIPLKPILQT